jgi:hypothetical protein
LTSLAKETDGGRGTSSSVKTMQIPPANVMDRVGSGAPGKGTGAGNMAVDDGIGDEVGKQELNERSPVEEGGGRLEGANAC